MLRLVLIACLEANVLAAAGECQAAKLTGSVIDDQTGKPVAARLHIRSANGQWHFAESADPAGKAVTYKKQRGEASAEMHTALSAHPFLADLPPGIYTLSIERGKEYLPVEQTVEIAEKPINIEIKLRRWIDMASRGWYSGDTHVHRTMEELPTAMLADDLNVALPLTYWVTKSDTPPAQGDKNLPAVEAKVIEVAPGHLIWPLNTEYEIFTVGGKQHTLGAVFGLGHKTELARGVPPVRPIAEQVHREGGLLDLDKHNWPWSMALVPVMNVDLFELANNHHWRTAFAFRTFGEPIPDYMRLPRDPAGFDEKQWTEFGFQNYYALLNCGFRLMPTAGTASGVHPVPLGWGRVYVNCGEQFTFDSWMRGLREGRSFVSTGPLMFLTVNGEPPQARYEIESGSGTFELEVKLHSTAGEYRVEWIRAGEIPFSAGGGGNALQFGIQVAKRGIPFRQSFTTDHSTWFAVRCFEVLPDGRERFAHSAPIFIDVKDKPLAPRKAEVEYLIGRVQSQIERSKDVLSPESLAEYREALARYQEIAKRAK